MHLDQRRLLPALCEAAGFRVLRGASVLMALACARDFAAGQTTAAPTGSPTPGLISQTPLYSSTTGSTVGGAGEATSPWPGTPIPSSPLAWYPFQFYPHLDYQATYGNGLQSSPGESQKTVTQTVSPGLRIRWRDIWSLDYTPSFVFYSSPAFRNTVNQSLSLNGATSYRAWDLSVSQTYSEYDQALVETASQTSEQTIGTSLSAGYHVNEKLTAQFGVSQIITLAGETSTNLSLSDSTTWTASQGLRYQYLPQLAGTLTLSESYNSVQHGNDIVSEQLVGGLEWQPGERLTLTATAGASYLQYTDGGASSTWSPIFSATARYQLFDETALFVGATRSESPALVSGQLSTTTTVSGGITQRLLGQLQLVLDGGYSHTEYDATSSGGGSVRNDDTTSFSASLSRSFLTRGTASVFYSYSNNSSTTGGFGYNSHQIGLALGYHY